MYKELPEDKSLVTILLIYAGLTFTECFVVFTSANLRPELYDPNHHFWSFIVPPGAKPITDLHFFGFERTILLLLLPISVIVAWFAWQFLGCVLVSYAFIPYHKGSILAKLAPKFFGERPKQRYLIAGESSHKKNLKSIVKATMLPFSLLLGISILIVKDVLDVFPTMYKAIPFNLSWMILMPSSVFINFALYIILPLLALVTPSIWILEGSGLRYHDSDKKIVVEVAADYKVAIRSFSGLAAATSFLSLLYDVMIRRGLGFNYIMSYLFFTILFLYPSTLLVTALYIHFSETQSIEKVLTKMKDIGFSLPQVSSIDIK